MAHNSVPHVWELDKNGYATDKVTKGCEWVTEGQGTASRKYDGVPVRVNGTINIQTDPMGPKIHRPNVLKLVGNDQWMPIDPKQDVVILEARERRYSTLDGMYEVCGPDILGNAEGWEIHKMIPTQVQVPASEGERCFTSCPRMLEDADGKKGLRSWLAQRPMEGVIFKHPDGRRLAKVETNTLRLTGPAKDADGRPIIGSEVELGWPRESDEEKRNRMRKEEDLDY